MNNKLILVTIIFVVALGTVAGIVFKINKAEKINKPAEIACTQEAKICPDGSTVSRIGPSCEFAPCPMAQQCTIDEDCGPSQCGMTGECSSDGQCYQASKECPMDQDNIVGNDRDEHGCIPSAGYSWCEEKQKCLRTWDESCSQANSSNSSRCSTSSLIIRSGLNVSNWKSYKSKHGILIKLPGDWVEWNQEGSGETYNIKSIDDSPVVGDKNEMNSISISDYTYANARNENRMDWIHWLINFQSNDEYQYRCENVKCGKTDCVKISKVSSKQLDNNPEYIFRFKDGSGIMVLAPYTNNGSHTLMESIIANVEYN